MLLASTMAGIAMNSTRLGLAHALAMPLGSYELRIPHGLAIGITLPVVMKFNHAARFERYIEVARALGEAVDQLPATGGRRAEFRGGERASAATSASLNGSRRSACGRSTSMPWPPRPSRAEMWR